MVHWIYILRCTGDACENTSKGHNDKIYVGETVRLFRRLREHTVRGIGSCTTSESYPNRLMGLYKVMDKEMFMEEHTRFLDDENTITEMYMQAMGPKWKNVYGGKYHNGYRPQDNLAKNKTFYRPFCHCKIPADIKEYKDKRYWRCSRKNIWPGLKEYIVNELDMSLQNIVEPCKFYKEYDIYGESEKYQCDNLIYNYPRKKDFEFTGKCLIMDESDDE